MKKNFKIKTGFLAAFLLVIIISCKCNPTGKVYADRNQYPGLLVLNNKTTFFADLGAWHAYSSPATVEEAGGFTGPYLLDSNKFCVSKNLLKFTPVCGIDTLVPQSLQSIQVTYYPGRIEQSYDLNGIHFLHDIEFVDNRSALIRFSVKNTTDKPMKLDMVWQGKLGDQLHFILYKKGIEVEFGINGKKLLTEPLDTSKGKFHLTDDGKGYQYKQTEPLTIAPGKENVYYFRQTYLIDNLDEQKYKSVIIVNPSNVYKSNFERWNNYLTRVFENDSKWLKEEKYRRVAVKAIMTLIVNWRSAAGDLLHDGITPSINLYDGFWAWDSWKHAAACALFDPELGKSNIEAMFDYQDEKGMIADCIYVGKSENNLRDTKPPLAAWAVWEVYKASGDTAFLKKMFPKLVKYHEWWYKYRDHDHNHLCEYGSTDGTRVAAAWESGMDNAVRYDSAIMVKNSEGAWSLNQESVDLNSFLYREKIILAQMMEVLHDKRKDTYLKNAAEVKNLINKLMYNPEKGFYFDIKLQGKAQITLMGSEGWHPLWAGVASQEQAKKVSMVMADPKKFNTYIPLPTFQADHKSFDPAKGYWRGPIWLDQVYFGIEGLRNYGFNTLANSMLVKTIDHSEGMLTNGPFRENYNPITGQGLEVENFSWAAAHTLMMLTK